MTDGLQIKPLVAVFCGGRGSQTLIDALARLANVRVACLINGYDDGLSTGLCRRWFAGMLGPSDFRKTASGYLSGGDSSELALAELLEHRLTTEEVADLRASLASEAGSITDLSRGIMQFNAISVQLANFAWTAMAKSLRNLTEDQWLQLSTADMALGNLIFAGLFLEFKDFNKALKEFNTVFCPAIDLINVSDGTNLFLFAETTSGHWLPEDQIVSEGPKDKILALKFSTDHNLGHASDQPSEVALVSTDAEAVLQSADLIIYGPGTQYSSLLPSYIVNGVGEAIRRADAPKVLVINRSPDFDDREMRAREFVRLFFEYLGLNVMNAHGCRALVDSILIDNASELMVESEELAGSPWLELRSYGVDIRSFTLSSGKRHDGRRLALACTAVMDASPGFTLTSLDVMVMSNDERENARRVMLALNEHDWLLDEVLPRFWLVSSVADDEVAHEVRDLPHWSILVPQHGRRDYLSSMKAGVEAASGDFVLFFPADNEYDVEDISGVLQALKANPLAMVYGSRVGFGDGALRSVTLAYEGRKSRIGLSRIGGILLSACAAFASDRYVADPFTSIRAVRRTVLQEFTLRGKGYSWQGDILGQLSMRSVPIVEVPVRYQPRSRKDGKSISVVDGLLAIFQVMKYRFRWDNIVGGDDRT